MFQNAVEYPPRCLQHGVPVLPAPRRLPVVGVAEDVVVSREKGIWVGIPRGSQQSIRVVQLRVFSGVGHGGYVSKPPSVRGSKSLT